MAKVAWDGEAWMKPLCWSLFSGTGPWYNQQKGVGGIQVRQGPSVALFSPELCLFHVCWKDFIPQDRLSAWPLLQTLRSFSAHEKARVWLHGSGGEAAVLQQKANLSFHCSFAFLPPPTEPCWEISDQTVNSLSTESSKPPSPPQEGLVCWQQPHSIWHLFHFKTGPYK